MPGSSIQPFSAPRPRSLPTAAPNQDVQTTLANWQTQLGQGIQIPAPQVTPSNFTVTSARSGMNIQWSPVQQQSGTDGYEILKSAGGTFTDDLQIIAVKNPNQSSFFDSTGATAASSSYRIRTTSGTAQNPQAQRGPESGPIRHTSLDATDTTTAPTTIRDNYTSDATRALSRLGNYGAFKLSIQGKTGSTKSVVGTGGAGGSAPPDTGGGGTPPVGAATTFGTLLTGFSVGQTFTVGSGTILVASGTGVIQATQSPWAGLFGDLTETQVVPWDGGTVGTPDTGLSRIGAGVLALGNGTAADFSGTIKLTNLTAVGTIAQSSGQVHSWNADTGLSRLGAASLALGNGTAGDFTGTLKLAILNAATGIQIAGAAASGNVLRGNGTDFISATLAAGDLSNGVTGTGAVVLAAAPSFTSTVVVAGITTSAGLTLTAAAPTVAVAQVGIGSTVAATATGGAATLPAAPVGFLVINVAGTPMKVPYYAT